MVEEKQQVTERAVAHALSFGKGDFEIPVISLSVHPPHRRLVARYKGIQHKNDKLGRQAGKE